MEAVLTGITRTVRQENGYTESQTLDILTENYSKTGSEKFAPREDAGG